MRRLVLGGLLLQLYVLSSSLEEVLDPLLCEKTVAGWPVGLLLQPQADLLVAVVVGPVCKVLGARGTLEGSLTGVDPLVGLQSRTMGY